MISLVFEFWQGFDSDWGMGLQRLFEPCPFIVCVFNTGDPYTGQTKICMTCEPYTG